MNRKQQGAQLANLPAFERIGILADIVRGHRIRLVVSTVGLIVVALLEGISILSLLPLLAVAIGQESTEQEGVAAWFQQAIDWVGFTPSLEVFLLLLVAIMALKTAINMGVLLYIAYRQADFVREARLELLRNLLLARWEYFVSQSAGNLTNAISREAQQVGRLFMCACNLISGLLQSAVYIGAALLISWQVTLGASGVGLLMLVLLTGLIERSRRASRRQTDLMASFSAELVDSIHGIKSLKAMGMVRRLESFLSADIRGMRDVSAKLTFYKRSIVSAQELIRVVAIAGALYFVIRFTDASFAALAVIAVLLLRTIDTIGRLQKEWQVLSVSSVPYQYVAEITGHAADEREHAGGTHQPTLNTGIGLEDVSFSYDDKTVFDGLDLFIPAGKFVCVLGPSGAGKTTLLDLVIGLLVPQSGRVALDGVSLETIDSEAWRRSIGYVPQEVFLFHDTLLSNVTLGDPSVSREDALRALETAGAGEFVAGLPDGLDTMVGERGGRLSGGQRQRISIARALVRQPRLLILDEASSALDTETESKIAKRLGSLAGEMTILAITHRPTLVEHADVVYHLKDGKLGKGPVKNRRTARSKRVAQAGG